MMLRKNLMMIMTMRMRLTKSLMKLEEQNRKQAGAELCQAQVKLGLAKLDLHSKTIKSSSLC